MAEDRGVPHGIARNLGSFTGLCSRDINSDTAGAGAAQCFCRSRVRLACPPPCMVGYGGLSLEQVPQQTIGAAQDLTAVPAACAAGRRVERHCGPPKGAGYHKVGGRGAVGNDSRPKRPSAHPPPQGVIFRSGGFKGSARQSRAAMSLAARPS